MKLEYRKCSDYLLPNFEQPPKPAIGKYGKLRHSYLRKYKEPLFTALMMKDQLNSHLEEIDRVATSSATTGSLNKTISLIIFKTHQQLNEIATLRNSYFEIIAIDTIQGNEIKEEKSTLDGIKNIASGLAN